MRGRTVQVACDQCGRETTKSTSHVNRAKRIGAHLYCSRACSGLARRDGRSLEEKRADKAAYDRDYRAKLGAELLAKKKAAYDAVKETPEYRAKQREQRRRQKESGYRENYLKGERYRRYKHDYDIRKRSREQYGEFAECHRLLIELEKEIRRRCPDKYERLKARGYYERQAEKCRMKRMLNNRL